MRRSTFQRHPYAVVAWYGEQADPTLRNSLAVEVHLGSLELGTVEFDATASRPEIGQVILTGPDVHRVYDERETADA